MNNNRSYTLRLSLPGVLLPFIHFAFGTGVIVWFSALIFLDQNQNDVLLTTVLIIVLISSGIGYWWWKILIGPISIVVYKNEVRFRNLFGVQTHLQFSEIDYIHISYIFIRIKTVNGEHLTSNTYRGFNRLLEDLQLSNPHAVITKY